MKETVRRLYVRPEMERVMLVPAEAVLSACKTSSASPGPYLTGGCVLVDVPCHDQIS